MALILPSLFAADIMHLKRECDSLYEEGFEILHVDMMDGVFVPHIAFGFEQIRNIKNQTKMKFDVHMMVSEPEHHIEKVLETGAEMISVHVEASPHIRHVIDQIKQHGRKAGVVLNPGTSPVVLKPLLNVIDYILVMSINPGRPGQSFIADTIDKIREVKEMIGDREIQIEVDGGIEFDTARLCIDACASMIVVGSYLFADNKANLNKLKTLHNPSVKEDRN